MKILVTGAAGFIGSNLVERLLKTKAKVIAYDDLSNGRYEFIRKFEENPNFVFIKADLLNLKTLNKYMKGTDMVFHLAANSDIQKGTDDTSIDLNKNVLATYNVLESMRINNVKKLVFSSTSAVYGEVEGKIKENQGPIFPISLYGASKLACEAYISAYSHLFGIRAVIFRFANVVGKNSTHGVLYDFINQLKEHPGELRFLADGTQRKPYIEVNDLIEGMIHSLENLPDVPEIPMVLNIGPQDDISVAEIGDIVISKMGLKSDKLFQFKDRGWPGDIRKFNLDTSRLETIGWAPKYSSRQAIEKAVEDLLCKH
jgi:UDP-glucose 4-epimerase